jgi:hypothetical protein
MSFKVPSKIVLTSKEYHAHPAIGSTSLKHILRSPAHYKYEKENPSEPTPAMQLGTAVHEAILEPNLFANNAIIMPKFEGTGSRAAKEQWLIENDGKTVLTKENYENIMKVLEAIQKHPVAKGLLSDGAAEESYFWQDPRTGLVCKCRPDYLRKGHIVVDVKTTYDASPEAFTKQIANLKYHVSAAHYLAGVSAVENQKFDQFILLAIEPKPPFGMSIHLLDDATIDAGHGLAMKALITLKECKEKNYYPGYTTEILTTALPNWAWPDEDEVA